MSNPSIRRTVLRSIFAGTILLLLAPVTWEAHYYGPYEHKDLRYQLWKLGLYPLRIDGALETMVVDPRRDTLVLGKTKAQLVSKFGYVSSIGDSNSYMKYCYDNSPYKLGSVLVIRNSNWMVVMKDGRAIDLVLAKGC